MHTKLMGILNVTPDSFFDQGRWFDPQLAIERGKQIFLEGADILDIGGESTKPGAKPVSEKEELNRVIPVLQHLKAELSIPISIDTMKVKVAEEALKAGASLINDVSGFRDPFMRKLAVETRSTICVMHMHQTPTTMQNNPIYPSGVIPFLIEWFSKQIDLLLSEGVQEKQIILDPGIGFGKTVADNVKIVQNLHKIKELGFPLLIGLSRKSFLGKIIHKTYPELLPSTLAANTLAILAKVDILRVHDVAAHKDILKVMQQFFST
ncbi:dihydropteroate synthase [Candidatus Protochlamydia sp. R18]|uniref:dihydropteroate synthase n=1 Tax=Candidatus Protochlamydia sp. R18 TaxID=1353977 RepID=UPI0005A9FFB9|nr:dihydropteroate synthase [Candidatus Protochlamydia sp. R18]